MNKKIKTFGIIADPNRLKAKDAIIKVAQWSDKNGARCFIDDNLKGFVGDNYSFLPKNEIVRCADFMITLGGDGTFLATAREVGDSGVPILGINLGSLGFLTQQPEKDMISSLERVLSDDYEIEKRMILQAETHPDICNHSMFALNEMVVDRGASSRLITIDVIADDDYVSSYRADGLIISTPTGSTAYSLSAGGPIVFPTMDAMIISPICPHSLTQRPLIVAGDTRLELVVESEREKSALKIDGQLAFPLLSKHRVSIKRAFYHLNLVRFSDSSYFSVLREKLHLGRQPNIGM